MIELLGNNEFTARFRVIREHPASYCLLTPVRGNLLSAEGVISRVT